jgi:hypothetical protein
MTRVEHLWTILAEECVEVAQRVSKVLRFGHAEVQPGQPLDNAQRVNQEMMDLMAVCEMLHDEGVLPSLRASMPSYKEHAEAKKAKVEKFLVFSAGQGLVDGVPADHSIPHPEAK